MDGSAPELPGGTVTFLFSDVEGSTRLAATLGERFADALGEHRRIVRAALKAHGGFEVSTAGDSFFAVFPLPEGAAAAAVAMETGLRTLAAPTSDDPIRVRIGLHTGQAVRVGRDYVGLDVHLAARVSDAGNGGQILVSEATHAAIRDRLPAGCTLTDLGRHRLKDVGPQRVWQLDGPGVEPGRFPALRSLEAHPSNLPLSVSPIVDRERERAELADLLRHAPVVTVTGAGGIGKTRVALEVARGMVSEFPDGVFYVDLIAAPDAAAVAEALLDLMGARQASHTDPRAALREGLRSRDLLLLLDTADRVAEVADLVTEIAATCPRIRVLLTSRSPLHLASEVEFPLPPLPSAPAVELFNTRARAVRAQALDDPAMATAVARLVERLDGIPLAIELAAARTKLFTPAALLDRLERRLPSLGQGARDLPDRQRTLHDTISWSCELLQPAEQAVFRELGVFVGAFDLAAVEAVVAPQEREDTVSLLEALVDRSLVTAASGDGEPHFRLLGPIREFAADALRAAGHEDDVRERHARHWIAFATERMQGQGQPGLGAFGEVEAHEPDMRAALEWSLAGGDERAELGLELAGALGRYWWLRGRVQEGIDWLERALSTTAATSDPAGVAGAAADAPSVRTLHRALFWAGVLLNDAGRSSEAMARLEACLAVQRQIGDEVGVARTLNSLGVVARSLGDLDRAQALLEESVERKRALGDRSGIPVSLSNLGVVASDRDQFDEAVRFMREALEIDEELGGGTVVLSHANLGAALIRAGSLADGEGHLRIALPGVIELGDPELVVEVLTSLAWVALASADAGAPGRAARLVLAVDAIRRREGLSIRASEVRELDDLLGQVSGRLPAPDLADLRAQAAAIDLDAALSLAREALKPADGLG